ncbi:MAG TPA: hypothetical protein PLR18_02740 [bacterium]|nr:hypothetical protein [bacterium]
MLRPISRQSQGIALVLSVLILANLMMITLIVADVILRIGKTSREIGESESAYYAAEAAVEKAVYALEKNHDGTTLGTEIYPSMGTLSTTEITWRRYLKPIFTTPIICIGDDHIYHVYDSLADISASGKGENKSCVYTDDPGIITESNPLRVKLRPGKSFELDFSIAVPSGLEFYPSSIYLNWDKSTPGSLVILDSSGQTVIDTSPSPSQPQTDTLTNSPNWRARFINNATSTDATYVIGPHDNPPATSLPSAVEIVGKGYYNGQKERIIVLDKRLWKIY